MAIGTAYGSSFTNRYGTWPKDGLQIMFWDNNLGSYPQSGTTIKDLSGKGNNGTLNNFANPPTSTSGFYDGAIQYDGIDDYINFPNSWITSVSEFSWHFVVKLKGAANSYGNNTMSLFGIIAGVYIRFTNAGAGKTVSPFIKGALTNFFMYFSSGNVTNITITDLTKFYQVSICVKPGLITTYFDGEVNNQQVIDIGSLPTPPQNLGRYDATESWYGNVPVFLGYNKYISPEEIKQIYNYFKRLY